MTDAAPPRKELMDTGFDEQHAHADALAQFAEWFDTAIRAGLPLPNAMTLATASNDGKPSARMVLLKEVQDGSFVFYTNYESRKAREIAINPHAALLFHWPQLERQVRIEGLLARVDDDESDAYFATRPLGSRHAAIASPQSHVIANRDVLQAWFDDVAKKTGDHPPRPPYWGGYRLLPEEIEFWQGRTHRLHDRMLYRKSADGWTVVRLAP